MHLADSHRNPFHTVGQESADHLRFDSGLLASPNDEHEPGDQVRGLVLNKVLIIATVLITGMAVIAFPQHSGFSITHLLLSLCSLVIIILAFLRRRTGAALRKNSLVVLLCLVGACYLFGWSMIPEAMLFFSTASLMAAFFQRATRGVIVAVIAASCLVTAIVTNHNLHDRLPILGVFLGCNGLLILITHYLHHSFDETIQSLNNRTTALQQSHTRLREETAERLRMEQELAGSMRLRSLATMSSGIAHEINQPLNTINLKVGLMEMQADSGAMPSREDLQRRCHELTTEVERVAQIIKDMRDLAKTEQQQAGVPTSISEAVEAVRNRLHERLTANQVTIHLANIDTVPLVRAHRLQLEQIFMNLFDNALRAFNENHIEAGQIFLLAEQSTHTVTLTFRDNGPGFGEHADQVCDPFYTKRPNDDGQGLGLALVYAFITAWDGQIKISDHEDGGACIRLIFRKTGPAGRFSSRGEHL